MRKSCFCAWSTSPSGSRRSWRWTDVYKRQLYQPWSTSALLKLSKSKQTAYKIAFGKWEQLAYTDISQLTIGVLQDQLDEKAPTFYQARDMKS